MPHANQHVSVRDGYGGFVGLDPAIEYAEDDELVLRYPHFFAAPELPAGTTVVNDVVVEVAVPKAPRPAPARGRRRATR